MQAGRYDKANTQYTECLGMLLGAEEEHGTQFGAHLEIEKMDISMACLLNQGACSLKTGHPESAVEMCTAVLSFDPASAKALFRRSQVRIRHWFSLVASGSLWSR